MTERGRERTNLTVPGSTFVGRVEELEALAAFFERARLVTVLGPGGIGKTRLAMRYAEGCVASFGARGGGVWFVDLSESRAAASALAAVAGVLGVDLAGLLDDDATAETIGERISRMGRTLIILDNAEPVSRVLAPVIDRWIRAAPGARLLVTSRVALEVDAEQVLPLGPLSRDDATALFLGRARLVRPDMTDDLALVAEIVDAIDRMPLAIELAASRTHVLSASDLRQRLTRRLEVLRRARADGRHASMRRAVLDSVDLLSAPTRRLFALASILRNGFTLDDAEAILGEHMASRAQILDGLDELARTSLLRVHIEPGEPARHAYFETIRDVAEELASEDPALPAARAAHARHYAALAPILGPDAGPALDNLLVAHATAVELAERNDDTAYAAFAVAIASGLEPLLSARGLSRLRARIFERTLAALAATATTDHEARARAHLGRGLAHRELGETALARADFEAALGFSLGADLDGLSAVALTRLGGLDDVAGDTDGAHVRFAEALRLLARTPDDELRIVREAEVQLLSGHAHRREGNLDAATAAISRAVERYRALGQDEGLAAALYELAIVEMFAGRRARSRACFDEGLAVARRGGARVIEGALTTARGCLLQEEGALADALAHHAEAARIFGDLGSRYREASALYYLATTYVERGRPDEALAVLAQARRRLRVVGAPRYEALMASAAATSLAMLDRLDEADAEVSRAAAALARVPSEPSLAVAVSVHRLLVDVRAGRRDAEAALAEAGPRVRARPNDDAGFALRALRLAVRGQAGATTRDALVVWPEASAFTVPGSTEPVSLPEGSPLRRILDHLATRRIEAPGEVVSLDEVIAAGWPGEHIGTEAALNRAYVALSTLRKKGLRDVLVRTGGGYAISQAVIVRREAEVQVDRPRIKEG